MSLHHMLQYTSICECTWQCSGNLA